MVVNSLKNDSDKYGLSESSIEKTIKTLKEELL